MSEKTAGREDEPQDITESLRLRVIADADPAVLTQVLAEFQNQNVCPRRVCAECGSNDKLYIEVDIFGLNFDRVSAITAKVRRLVCVLNAHWHRL